MHHTPLIATIAASFVFAFILGMIANRLRFPPIVGYLVAGVIVGPFTPGFVADADLAAELAEIGVILLMFGVGLHFSYKDLFAVRNIAIPGAVAQITVATMMGMALAYFLGWPLAGGLVFGLALSVASTVVLLRALEERQLVDTRSGHVAVGWLIVEDIATIFALVLLPVLAQVLPGVAPSDPAAQAADAAPGGGSIAISLALTFGKLAVFTALTFIVGRRVIPWALARVAGTGSRELFTLSVLAIGIGVAYGAAVLFDVSFALGAFFAGMILKESELSHQAADNTLPLRDAFAVLFFVSVGMLFNPMVVLEHPLAVLATLFIIVVGKSVAAFVIVRAFRYPTDTALLISASLAQIGEFSFILITLGLSLNLIPETARDLVLAGAILSIMLNPAAFALAAHLRARRLAREAAAQRTDTAAEPVPPEAIAAATPYRVSEKDHVIVVGYGRVGRRVADALQAQGAPAVVIEADLERVEAIRTAGGAAILGNAVRDEVLRAAGIEDARHILVAVPNGLEAGEIVAHARKLNPRLRIVARAHLDAEVEHIKASGADRVIMGEREIARQMLADLAPAD
ncbi:MAG TPA: YbaL family putative K(+) efflux transporter [Vitreimonas sp.]|uniref:YbaL family putative K(+) efflux transporter n=1 Tax=Vitreimonas sp. TaxID=3069702 RepID=UPI002D6696A0|nr:YbaL family putative K(+) efflux transporter [Vitreimonas sp.]HYD86113.1 YbaL family putative K(+) efflux transporter [Vitreimonas sp.]